MTNVEVVAQEALTVKPGDTLIVRVSPGMNHEQFERFRVDFMERLPDIAVVVVACEQLAAAKR